MCHAYGDQEEHYALLCFFFRTAKAQQLIKQVFPAPPKWVPLLCQCRAQLAALELTPYRATESAKVLTVRTPMARK